MATTERMRGGRWRAMGLGVAGGLALILLALSEYFWSALTTIAPRTQLGDLAALATDDNSGSRLAAKLRSDQPVNILVLGYGGPGHGGPYLTDSMLLLSVRSLSQKAVMISIPRDLVAPIPALPDQGTITARINLAYAIGVDRQSFPNVRDSWRGATGGGDLAAATVTEVTGLAVDYWIAIDFSAFRQVVNALGGIDITIPEPLDDPYFPAGETTKYTHIHFDAGRQHLNGERALEYARSRQTTSDFDRSTRQRLLVLTIRRRIDSLAGLPRIVGLVSALRDNVRTNLRPIELRQLANLLARIPQESFRQLGLDDSNVLVRRDLPDGTYVLSPRDESFVSLHRYLAAALASPPAAGS